jgi:hypothetical protein
MSDNKKSVTVLATYKFRKVARICFTVLSSKGDQQYNCCFSNDAQHASCSCPATRECYHISQLRERAAAYFESRKLAAPVSSSVAILVPEGIAVIDRSELTAHDILAPAQVAPRMQEDWDAPSLYSTEAERIERDYRERASLERGAFSILR